MSDSLSVQVEAAFQEYVELVRAGQKPVLDDFLQAQDPQVRQQLPKLIQDFHELRREFSEASLGLDEGGTLEDYRLVREIGRGGMAVVWEAEQISLNRKVALKVLLPIYYLSSKPVERFQREARAGGRLVHPGIVQTHALERTDSYFFIVQELVEGGETLATRIERARASRDRSKDAYRRLAELFLQLAHALQHAHDHDVIHRDIKPTNILITPEGDPKVTDFGLARIESELGLSRTGEFAGTPFYMSPEQVAAKRIGLDHRTDVFSLGATLYEALTLTRPFNGDTSQQVCGQILNFEPPAPRKLRSQIPKDLETICLRAIEKSPDRRYADMNALAEDLRRFLAAEPILAKPPGPLARTRKWAQRHPVGAVSGSIAFVAIAIISTLYWMVRQEKETVLLESFSSSLRAARLALEEGNPLDAKAYLGRCPPAFRGWEWHHLQLKADEDSIAVDMQAPISTMVTSADRRFVAVADKQGGLAVWDDHEREVVARWEHSKAHVLSLDFTSAGDRLCFGTSDGLVRIWPYEREAQPRAIGDHAHAIRRLRVLRDESGVIAIDARKQVWFWGIDHGSHEGRLISEELGAASCLDLDPTGRWLAIGSEDRTISIRALDDFEEHRRLIGHGHTITDLDFGPEGNRIVSASQDTTLRLWELGPSKPPIVLTGHTNVVQSCRFDPSGTRIASGALDRTVRLWDAESGKELPGWFGSAMHDLMVWTVRFDGSGRFLASSSQDATIKVWDTELGQLRRTIRAHRALAKSIAFSSDATAVLSGSGEGVLRRNTLRRQDRIRLPEIGDFALSPKGDLLATRSRHGSLHVWDAVRGFERFTLAPGDQDFQLFGWLPDTEHLLVVDVNGQVQEVDLEQGRLKEHAQLGAAPFNRQALSVDTGLLARSSFGVVSAWDLRRKRRLHELTKQTAWIDALAVDPVRQRVACAGVEGAVFLWDPSTDQTEHKWSSSDRTTALAYSIDGRRLFAGSAGGSIRIFDSNQLEPLETLQGHLTQVVAFAFHPDGRRMASGSVSGTIKIWDLETRQELLSLQVPEQEKGQELKVQPRGVSSLSFTPSGERLFALSASGELVVWETRSETAQLSAKGYGYRKCARRLYLSGIHPDAMASQAPCPEHVSEQDRLAVAELLRSLWQFGTGPTLREKNRWAWFELTSTGESSHAVHETAGQLVEQFPNEPRYRLTLALSYLLRAEALRAEEHLVAAREELDRRAEAETEIDRLLIPMEAMRLWFGGEREQARAMLTKSYESPPSMMFISEDRIAVNKLAARLIASPQPSSLREG